MKINIAMGLLPVYMKLRIMTSAITAIHHAHDYHDTLTIYCSDGAAAGSSPEPDPDPELIVEISGGREVRWRCLEGSPSGAGRDGIHRSGRSSDKRRPCSRSAARVHHQRVNSTLRGRRRNGGGRSRSVDDSEKRVPYTSSSESGASA